MSVPELNRAKLHESVFNTLEVQDLTCGEDDDGVVQNSLPLVGFGDVFDRVVNTSHHGCNVNKLRHLVSSSFH